MSRRNLAILALVAVAAGYPFLSITARLLNTGFDSMTQVYMRVALATLAGMIFFRKNIRWQKLRSIPARDLLPLGLMGVVGYGLFVYFITLGAIHSKLLSVSIVFSTTPFFSVVYSYLIFKKIPTRLNVLLLVTTFAGVAIVASKSYIPILTDFGKGELYTLIASGLFAWYFIGRKMLSSHLNYSEISVLAMAIAAATAFILALMSGETIILGNLYRWEIPVGLALGATLNLLDTYLESFALAHVDATLGNQILLLENVFASILGYILYREVFAGPEIVGGLLVVGSVWAASRYS